MSDEDVGEKTKRYDLNPEQREEANAEITLMLKENRQNFEEKNSVIKQKGLQTATFLIRCIAQSRSENF